MCVAIYCCMLEMKGEKYTLSIWLPHDKKWDTWGFSDFVKVTKGITKIQRQASYLIQCGILAANLVLLNEQAFCFTTWLPKTEASTGLV